MIEKWSIIGLVAGIVSSVAVVLHVKVIGWPV